MASNLTTRTNGDVYSYETCIFTRTAEGVTIGNVTRYSQATSRHQAKAFVRAARVCVDNVPRGCDASGLRTLALPKLRAIKAALA